MADSKTFSLRIVSLDYYMASPIPGIDFSYSSFHGGKVNEVPVIRIYGSTPVGQKTCLHVHRILPYLYVPCADIPLQNQEQGDAYTHKISLAIDKALQLKSKSSSKRQYVHGCNLVRGKKFYGYHSSEELFVKIYLYYPHDVSRAANLLLGGGVFGKCLQPHEAHIPFILQFLVDYNLYGMGHIHLSKVKFRHPVPDVFCPRKSVHTEQSRHDKNPLTCGDSSSQEDMSGNPCFDSPVWTSVTVPADWMWYSPSEFDESSSNQGSNFVKRQSLCHLEGDSTADEILNQDCKAFTSLSQTRSDVKMVQSLVPIWEEEYERTGMQEIGIHSDPSKPLPEDVLKTLSLDPELFIRFTELHNEAEIPLSLSPSDKDVKSVQPIISLPECLKEIGTHGYPLSQEEDGKISSTERIANVKSSCDGEVGASQPFERLDDKAGDKEALGLLKWLASSQAVDDINSDDELLRETILSPFLPENTFGDVLARANMEYESESQKECQEILDSIQDLVGSKDMEEKYEFRENENSTRTSYHNVIPQVDGSGDDIFFTPDELIETQSETTPKKIDEACENPVPEDTLLENKVVEDAHSTFTHKHKRKTVLWGSLPFSTKQEHIGYCSETKGPTSPDRLSAFKIGQHENSSVKNLKETKPLVECSVRDLMRKKRKYRVESVQCSSQEVEKTPFEMEQKEDTLISPKRLDFQMFQANEPNKRPHHSINLETPLVSSQSMRNEAYAVNSQLDGRVNVLSGSESSLVGASRDDGNICSRENNFDVSGAGPIRSSLLVPTISHYVSGLKSDVHFLKSDHEDRIFSDMGLGPKNAAASSSFQTAMLNEELGVESGKKVSSPREWAHEMSSEKPYNKNSNSNTLTDVTNLNRGKNQEEKVSLPLKTDTQDRNLIGLTFCGKPPATNWIDRRSTRALSCPVISYLPCPDEESRSRTSDGKPLDEFLPFFLDDHKKKSLRQDNDMAVDNSTLLQEASVGIPIVYQNDGSYLYLLSPIVPPPTAENVKRWLLTGTSIEGNKVATKSSVMEGTSGALIGSQNSSLGGCYKASPESGSTFHQQHVQPPGSQENCDDVNTIRSVSCNKKAAVIQRGVDSARVKTYSGCSQEISQISGPDGKSKQTPLSQTGFWDPASVGGGQQLTLLSVEVQAASRGDLRPDPQFDAINIIVLAVQSDSDYDAEIHVLLYSKSEDCLRNLDGVSGCSMLTFCEEKYLLDHFIKFICSLDPDILMGWDVQGGSLGFLAERASHLGISLLNCISRTPPENKGASGDAKIHEEGLDSILPGSVDPVKLADEIISDEWGRTHASGVHVGGRIVLNVWRLMRGELNLNMYTVEAVADAVLRRKIPHIPYKVLTKWISSGPGRARYRCIEFVKERAKLNLELMNQLDMINRTSELARVFGIDFFSVLSRGSQYRVESMYLRLAHTQNYLSISPGSNQVASQPAMECLPLVMEPESGFYADPVVVLDFQSLYPSMIIGYNLCYSTCLGNTVPSKQNVLGVATFSPDLHILQELKDKILLTPNGVMYVQSKVRKGVLPRLLEEILSTRIMVKQAMKKLSPSQQVLHRIFNARQLALKLIANVTYGYTAAGFSGRMPCAELADSIVQCGRRTLENAISFVNSQEKWKARVIYGDTDSMFVLLKGRSIDDAFRIGNEIASEISAMNPNPVVLKMEKVYHPCFLLTKKRYVGYSYENPNQKEPLFDAKGIETVRRDTCRAVSKTLEQSLRLYFEHQDISEVKEYLQRQWKRILSGRVSLQDFVFAKEVRLGTYSARDSSSLPPAAIVATKAMRTDRRAEPRYGDRIPYIVVHGQPGARLVDMVVDPLELLAVDSPYRLNDAYYITKQIIPALQRVFGLVGADLSRWFSEVPRTSREAFGKRPAFSSNPVRARIDYYYLSKHCVLCGELVEASTHLCRECSRNGPAAVTAMVGRTSKLEREMQHLAAICRHCGGGDWVVGSGVKCTSLACLVFYERCKVQKELQGLATVAADKDLYPKCMVEWF